MRENTQKALYNTVLSQVFSSCGQYLFAGNNFGDIFILSLKGFQRTNDDYSSRKLLSNPVGPIYTITVGQKPINSLEYYNEFLIVGTIGKITGYKWEKHRNVLGKVSWEVLIPSLSESVESNDVLCMYLDSESSKLYVGCNDNNIYEIALDDGRIKRNFCGHKDYIHSLAMNNNTLYSASEDGSILIWNLSEKNPVAKIEPFKHDQLIRSEFGKWQGTVSVMNDWILCGGGPKPSMWHLRTMECTNTLAFTGKVHCSGFVDDLIFLAGERNFLHQYSFNGDFLSEIPISGPAAYSLLWQQKPFKCISIAGASNFLDICTNFNYKDVAVKLYNFGK